MKYDLAIIGAGPAGYVAAKRAGGAGLKVLLVEGKKLGGVCLNEGCVPSKTLLQAAKTYHHALHGEIFGVEVSGVRFNFEKANAHKTQVMDEMRKGIAGLMKKSKVAVVHGRASLSEGRKVTVDGETHEADWNDFPARILQQLPESLVVIGGGIIGCEFACFFGSVGVPVTVLEALPEICPTLDSDLARVLRSELAKKNVTFHVGAKVEEISGSEVKFSVDDESQVAQGDLVLVATGRRPNVANLGLDDLRVDYDERGGIKVDDRCATNVPGVWAAGDVTGRAQLAHAASRMAEVVVNNITGREDVMRYDAVPSVVYTNPEVAVVGLTKEQAEERGLKVTTGKIPMTINARYLAEHPGESGLCKVVVEKGTRRLLGVHMVGGACSEMIFGAAAMLETELREEEIDEIIFPHPTTSEIMKDVFMAVR